jgi:hypothetical protein
MNDDPKAIVDVVFAEADHFGGKPIETMVNLTEATTKVVSAFEQTFLT